MAIAGRVAIIPKGEWSESVTYDKLDLVTHNGNAFIAYKSSAGVEPVDGDTWMLVMEGVSSDDVENLKTDVESIINGTTSVGNALQLGGKDASEYVDVFEFVEDVNSITKSGFYRCTTNLPFDYGLANVIMVGDTSNTSNIPTQIAFGIDLNPTTRDIMAVRSYDGYNWTQWKTADFANFLKLSGGILALSGAIEQSVSGNLYNIMKNQSRRINNAISSNGNYELYDSTNSKPIILSTVDGTNTFNGVANGNLPITGTYIGNGDATARNINVGGISRADGLGEFLLISESQYITVVGFSGAVSFHLTGRSAKYFTGSQMNFKNGVLYIATNDGAVNYNIGEYHYRVV